MLTTQSQPSIADLIKHRQLSVVFQPIYNLATSAVLGYEALIRGPEDTELHSPLALFAAAEKNNQLPELELLCREKAIAAFAATESEELLFLNINSQVLRDHDVPQLKTLQWLNQFRVKPSQVVFEISELYPIPESSQIHQVLSSYRQAGVKIALDDVGTGYSGPRAWAEIEPEFIKIDRFFNSGIHTDKNKRKFLRAAARLASELGTHIICEGIEHIKELEQITSSEVSFGQGFLLNKPNKVLLNKPSIEIKSLGAYEKAHLENVKVGILLKEYRTVDNQTTAGQLAEIFYQNSELLSMPVVVDEKPVGLVWRSNLLEKFSTPFGRALHEAKPVTRHLADGTVIVDVDTPLNQVSNEILANQDERLPWHFIITKNERYLGIGSVRDLLGEITKRQILYASYANPLSMLPGNVPIDQQIENLLANNVNFYLAYFDLNNFKPYNDVYGYAKGDKVIQFVADILKTNVHKPNFIGHIGGDDFVALFLGDDWLQICNQITEQFDQDIAEYYDSEHIAQGGINAKDREGNARFYPLLGLAVGVVNPAVNANLSHHKVAELATEAKSKAKQFQHSFTYLLNKHC